MTRVSLRARATMVASLAVLALGAASASAATFVVTKSTDTLDGACDADCSLREAVQAANADATADEIVLPAGPVRVSRFGPSEDANATGDVDVQRDLTIRGAGPHLTTIAALTDDRVLDVQNAGTDLRLVDLAIEGGRSPLDEQGGGIDHPSDGELSLERVVVRGNIARGTATGFGGGLHKASGRLVLRDVAVVGNAALGSGYGGGVFVTLATTVVEMTNVTIAANLAGRYGGGMYSNNAIAGTLVHVTAAGNEAALGGGGLGGDLSAFRLRSSIVAGNVGGVTPNCGPGPASDGGNVGDPACGFTLPTDAQTLDPLVDPLSTAFSVPVMVPRDGSVAIDRAIGICPAADARGLARPQGAGCDAGAAEREAPPAPPPAVAPLPRTLPRILGRVRVGVTLRCRPARFIGAAGTRTAWLRNGRAIRRATGIRYKLRRADRGKIITCRSTGTGAGGRTSVVSLGVLVRR